MAAHHVVNRVSTKIGEGLLDTCESRCMLCQEQLQGPQPIFFPGGYFKRNSKRHGTETVKPSTISSY